MSQTPTDHIESWERIKKRDKTAATQKGGKFSALGTRARLPGGFGTAAGPDPPGPGTLPQAWRGRGPAPERQREGGKDTK